MKLTRWTPGPSCLKVVAIEIGGTTALEFHCSGSWPAWIAKVPKCGKGSSLFCPDSFAILEEEERKARGKRWWHNTRNNNTLCCEVFAILVVWSQGIYLGRWRKCRVVKGTDTTLMLSKIKFKLFRLYKHNKQNQNINSHLPQTFPHTLPHIC